MSLRSKSKHFSLGTAGGMPENQLLTDEDDQLHKAPQWRIQGVAIEAIAPLLAGSEKNNREKEAEIKQKGHLQ